MLTHDSFRQKRPTAATPRSRAGFALVALLIGVPCFAATTDYSDIPGYVDSSTFIELAGGEDAIRVQVTIPPSILGIVTKKLAEDLGDAVTGLQALHAVIVELDEGETRNEAREVIRSMRKRLEKKGWHQLALIKDVDGEVHVLILEGGESIRGLLVLAMDTDEGQLVFANIAGELDLAAIEKIGEQMDIPGLRDLEDL
jgi:hypothetical protein